MKKVIIITLIIVGCISPAAKKNEQDKRLQHKAKAFGISTRDLLKALMDYLESQITDDQLLDPDFLKAVALKAGALNAERPVDMLAALHREKESAAFELRKQTVHDGGGGVLVRGRADALPHDLAGRAADHKDRAGPRLRGIEQNAHSLPHLPGNGFKLHVFTSSWRNRPTIIAGNPPREKTAAHLPLSRPRALRYTGAHGNRRTAFNLV